MKHLNFLSKSGGQSMGLSSVTLALTVGSPSAHRRSTMLKLLSVLVLILTIGVGQMWGQASSQAPSNGSSYVVAVYSNSTYYALPNTTSNGGTLAGATVEVNNSGQVTTTNPPTWTLEEGTGTNANFAVNATNKNYWSFTSSGTGYTVTAVDRGTNHPNIYLDGTNFKCNSNTSVVRLLPVAASGPTITKSSSMTTFGCNMETGVPNKQSFTVSGTNLKAAISVTPPSGYEICTTENGTYQSTAISLPKNGSNAVATTTIWVRLKASNAAGSYSGNISCTSTDATTQTIAVSGSTPFKVTWIANGQTHATTYVAYAANPGTEIGTFPDDPDPDDYTCSGTNRAFYGWYNGASYKNANTAPDIIATSTKITSDKTFNAVFADASGGGSTTKWVLTSLNAVTEGTYALMTGDYHAFNGSISSGKGGITTNAFSFTNGEATSAPTGTCEITFQAVTGGFKMYNSSNGYLYAKGNTSGNLGWHNSESSYWSYASSNWVYNSNSARLRSYNDGNFNTYSSDNGNLITLAKKTTVSNTTYSNYMTTCCTTLGQINGSFSWTNNSATSVTVGVPSDYSDKNNENLTGYIFKRYTASTGGSAAETIETDAANKTTATFNNLAANTAYYYTITAKHESSSCNSTESARSAHTITSYVVSYAAGGGSGDNPGAHEPVLSGTKVELKSNSFTAPAGKEFVNWNDGNDGYDEGEEFTVTANTTMTAQWECLEPGFIKNLSTAQVDYLQGETAAKLSVTASANGAELSYAWERSTNGTTGWTSVGTDSNEYEPSTADEGDLYYRCTVTNGEDGCSQTATSAVAHIHVDAPEACLSPVFSVAGGTYNEDLSVTITCGTDGASIYYTTDGSTTPTSSSTPYTGAITVDHTMTLKAIAIKAELDNSTVTEATYTLQCATPTFFVDEGTYNNDQSVVLSSTYGTVYYTTDGKDPAEFGTEYTSAIPVAASQTIKAIAKKSNCSNSALATAEYTLKCATPTFSPVAGTYQAAQNVTISSTTSNATIRYTLDGSEPDGESDVYSSAVVIDASKTIRAKAFKSGYTTSDMGTAAYTINYPRTVTFNAGTGTPSSATVTEENYGDGITLPSAAPSSYCAAEGWTFAGWATSNSTTTAPTLKAGDSYNCAQTTLYAVYKNTEEDTEEETASVTISTYASSHSWSNDTKYESIAIDANITAVADGSSNTGKWYSGDSEWRFYQTENATITINAAESCTLKSATFTYNVKNTGELKDGTTAVASGDAYEISGTSKSFSVGNSGSATNGQVKFTAISVTYDKTISSNVYTSTPSCCDDEVTIAVASTTHGSFTVKQNTTSVVGEKLGTCTAAQTVTVTCSPDPGYHLGEVSQSLASGVAIEEVSENVYTITYAKNTKGTSTISVRFDETIVPSYTLSESSFTIGDVAKDATVERTFTVSAVHLEGEKVSLSSSNDKYSVSPNELTINNDGSVTLTDITVSLNTGATGSYSTTITLSDGASTPNIATVTLSATVKNQYSVRWFVNEVEQTESGTYLDGATISSKPEDPDPCDPSISFVGWTSDAAWEGKTNTKPTLKAASEITTATADVEYRAVFAKVGQSSWREANLADLTDEDKFVIVGNNGSNYAMTNDNGTSNPPAATSITIADGKLSNAPADNLQWNISGNATDGYTFYPNGSTTTWLYCTNTNNGVKVGTGDAKVFTVNSGYLYEDITEKARYIGIYDGSDWRCYETCTGQSNIAGQSFAFYKYIAPAVKDYMTTCAVTFSATYEAGSGTGDDYVVNNIAKNGNHTVLGNDVTGFTKDGYRFTGWKDGSTDRAVGYIYEDVTADLTLVAQWAEKEEAGLEFAHATYDVIKNGPFTKPTLTNPNDLAVTYNSSNESVATVDAEGNVTLVTDALGETTITASSATTEYYKAGEASYTLLVVEKWAMTYTSNLDVDANDYTVIINGTTYANQSHRYGTGSNAGVATINVPKNTQKLHFHAAGWNDETVKLKIEMGSNTLMTINALVREESLAGSVKTYTLTGKTSTDEYYCLDLSSYSIAANTAITFTATSGKRFLLYGVNEEGGIWELPSDDADESDIPSEVNVVVSKDQSLTINNAKTLNNLTVEAGGSLTLNGNSDKKLTVNDLTIETKAGQSGQVSGTNVQVSGGIYLETKLCDGVMDAEASRKWYCISAPFDVNMNGGFFWADGTEMVLNTHFQMFEYQGEKRARTGNGWQRVSGTMKANTAYFIGFDDERIGSGAGMNQNTIKLKANANTIPTAEPMQLAGHSSEIEGSNDWYGLGNPALHYVGVNKTAHVFGYEVQGYDVVPSWSTDFTGFVVGTAFFVQGTGELSFNNAASAYHAPKRQAEEYTYCVEINREGASHYDNRIFVRASEDAEPEFVQGKDEYTLNGTSSNYGALLWTENYGGKRLAIEDAPLVNGTASYVLTLSAPANGSYVISVAEAKDNADLYLTYEGSIIWNLSMGEYELDLNKGTTNGYGLLLQAKAPQVVTGVDQLDNGDWTLENVQKVIIDEHVFILRGGQMYDVTGKMVK